jgi:hypothetical protein
MKDALSQNKSTIVLHSGNLYRSGSDRTTCDTSDNVWRDLRKVRHNSYRSKTSKCDATLIDVPQEQAF